MSWCRRFIPAILIVSLLFIRGAWAQSYSGTSKSPNIETKSENNFLQPRQPCLNPDQGEIKGPLQAGKDQSSPTIILIPINKPFPEENNKKAGVTRGRSTKSNSLGTSFGKYEPVNPNKASQTGGQRDLLIFQRSKEPGGHGTSFLDGYLLRSLRDQKLERRKSTEDKQSKDDLRKKDEEGLLVPKRQDFLLLEP
jgi:hypothetical protein